MVSFCTAGHAPKSRMCGPHWELVPPWLRRQIKKLHRQVNHGNLRAGLEYYRLLHTACDFAFKAETA